MSDCGNCRCNDERRFERVLYVPATVDRVFEDQDDLTDFDGELVGVYTLSHIARVDVEPKRAVLRVVDIP